MSRKDERYEITPDYLREIFDVDLEAGILRWKKPTRYHRRLTGQIAGGPRAHSCINKFYWIVRIGTKGFKRGRLIFFLREGRWPFPCIDHKDGNSLNDRSDNLREATIEQNAWNHKGRSNKKDDLPMGLRLLPNGKYQARITRDKTLIYLGVFATQEEAAAIYQCKRKELFREFA